MKHTSSFARTLISICLLCAFALLIGACSKKSASDGTILDNSLSAKIPQNVIGFMSWDSTSDAYQRYAKSPWAQNSGSSSFLQGFTGAHADEPIARVMEVLGEMITPNSAGEPAPLVSTMIAFVAGGESGLPEIAVFAKASDGKSFGQKFEELKSTLKSEGLSITEQAYGPAQGFSLSLADQQAGQAGQMPLVSHVHFASTSTDMAIATSETLAAQLFAEDSPRGLDTLKATPAFVRASGKVAQNGDTLAYAFVDFQKLLHAIPGVAAAAPGQPVPVESLVLAQQMTESLSGEGYLLLPQGETMLTPYLSMLNGNRENTLIRALPKDTLMYLGLDAGVVNNVVKEALKSQPVPPELQSQLAVLDSFDTLGVGIRNASGPSPFPELIIAAQVARGKTAAPSLMGSLQAATASAGLPLSPWQKKEIEGTPADFVMSPLGVGLYLAEKNSTLVLASSERALGDTLKNVSGGSHGLDSSLSGESKALLSGDGQLVLTYLNFDRLAGLLTSVQGNLAMFTGGAQNFDARGIEQLRQMGQLSLSWDYQPNEFGFKTRLEKVAG